MRPRLCLARDCHSPHFKELHDLLVATRDLWKSKHSRVSSPSVPVTYYGHSPSRTAELRASVWPLPIQNPATPTEIRKLGSQVPAPMAIFGTTFQACSPPARIFMQGALGALSGLAEEVRQLGSLQASHLPETLHRWPLSLVDPRPSQSTSFSDQPGRRLKPSTGAEIKYYSLGPCTHTSVGNCMPLKSPFHHLGRNALSSHFHDAFLLPQLSWDCPESL